MEAPGEKKEEDSESNSRAMSILCLWLGGGFAFILIVFQALGSGLSHMADAPPDPNRSVSPMLGLMLGAVLTYGVFLFIYLANSKSKRAPLFAVLSLAAPVALVLLGALVR